ncbi:MAG TPA: YncE family protein [Candidatus Limnocylindrales bacterium]|nr:YncE family protein [Candidatus Limnocylindrales bacterium]
MKTSYVLFVMGLVAMLLFEQGCNCEKDPVDPNHYWVTCMEDAGSGTSEPVLTNGKDTHYAGQLFDPSQYSCPDTSNSPVWTGSGQPIYNTNGQPKPSSLLRPRAAARPPVAFLPSLLLDLPFPALRQDTENTTLQCSAAQPDILAINHDFASVTRLATCPFFVVAKIPVQTRPLQIAITPDGSTALVTSFDSAVNFIDLTSNRVTFTLATPGINPNGIAISPDGAFAYITNFVPGSGSISKIDLTAKKIVATIPTYSYPQNAVMSPDGEQLYVTAPYVNTVAIIDTQTFTQAYAFSVPAPRGIAFNSKGTKVFVASAGNPDFATTGAVLEFNTNNFQIANTYKVGLGPNDVQVLYGDQFVVTTNYEGKSVSKIDTVSGTVQTVNVTGFPAGLSIVN